MYLLGQFFFFCVCYTPDLVGALTGIRMNSVSRWLHLFPRRYSQEGRARVDPVFVNADAILPLLILLLVLAMIVYRNSSLIIVTVVVEVIVVVVLVSLVVEVFKPAVAVH